LLSAESSPQGETRSVGPADQYSGPDTDNAASQLTQDFRGHRSPPAWNTRRQAKGLGLYDLQRRQVPGVASGLQPHANNCADQRPEDAELDGPVGPGH